MKARPILFSGPMVRALLDGTKTQTRRAVKPQPPAVVQDAGVIISGNPEVNGAWLWLDHIDLDCASQIGADFRCPYGVLGDLLWVKETWQAQEAFDSLSPLDIGRAFEDEYGEPWCPTRYVADGKCEGSVEQWQESPVGKTRVSIHMPRWASRLTLPIDNVRIERLSAISDADARAEGIVEVASADRDGMRHFGVPGLKIDQPTPARAYRALWAAINGQASAVADPWVWAVSFAVHHRNVDAVMADAAANQTPPAPIIESQE